MLPASATDAVARPVGAFRSPIDSRDWRSRASSAASRSGLLLTIGPAFAWIAMISDSA